MNYLPQLTENEVQYVCSLIPLHHSISYFEENPRRFAKIMAGFRPKSLKTQTQASALLFRFHSHEFVSYFIEKHISNWIFQIQEHIAKLIKDGESRDLAFLHTLSECYFADNIRLFFKLVNEEYSEEYITLLSTAVNTVKEVIIKQDKLQKELKGKKIEIERLQTELNSVKSDLEETKTKLNECKIEIERLKGNLDNFEELKLVIKTDKKIIMTLKSKIKMREETINNLKNELIEIKDGNQQLEAQIRSELEKQRVTKISEQQVELKVKCPRDIEDFKEFLGYNLENIGIPINSEYYALLIDHLSKILFRGIPIVINRNVGKTLLKCIKNTLIGQPIIKTLVFRNDISIDDINHFLSSSERVVCLDNFVGNYNETELFPLFDNHKNKIIFLTVAYDRTINYVSKEFLRYCQYLNLNRIPELSSNAELTEDPSTIEEMESEPHGISQENRYTALLRKMLGEFGFHRGLVDQKCTTLSNEYDLCRVLAFDVLPYCVDVLDIKPYNTSPQLNKYAGNDGRCSYKNLFKEWFIQ